MSRKADIIISWYIDISKKKNLLSQFIRDTFVISMPTPPKLPEGDNRDPYDVYITSIGPHPIRRILANYASGIKPYRIGLMGFSEGCQGVKAILRSRDAGFIDTAIAIDGIASGFTGHTPNKNRDNVAISGIAPWIEFCKLASTLNPDPGNNLPIGRRTAIITHSSIIPPNFASTTATAKAILDTLFGSGNWPNEPPPSGISDVVYQPPIVLNGNDINHHRKTTYNNSPTKYTSCKNHLYVFGFNNLDPTGINDHIYQANVVSLQVLSNILIPNWNSVDPGAATCYPTSAPTRSISGFNTSYPSYLGVIPGCDPNDATNVPDSITDPNVPDSELPDGSLDYKKWIPQSEIDARKKEKLMHRIESMSPFLKILFLLTGGLLGYAGIKTVQAIGKANDRSE